MAKKRITNRPSRGHKYSYAGFMEFLQNNPELMEAAGQALSSQGNNSSEAITPVNTGVNTQQPVVQQNPKYKNPSPTFQPEKKQTDYGNVPFFSSLGKKVDKLNNNLIDAINYDKEMPEQKMGMPKNFWSRYYDAGGTMAAIEGGVDVVADAIGEAKGLDLRKYKSELNDLASRKMEAASNDDLLDLYNDIHHLKHVGVHDLTGGSYLTDAIGGLNKNAIAFGKGFASTGSPWGGAAFAAVNLIGQIGGFFRKRNQVKHLNRQIDFTNARQDANFANAAANVDQTNDEAMFENYIKGYDYNDGSYFGAYGGPIHIADSKKGTFTAAANRHDMGVQEFASKVLANKEDYSPAMVKKANFARNAAHWHAAGGNLFSDFNNGVTIIDNGGTHEENPFEGVQMGIAPDGKPNLVEEGEVIYNDYVFSNRLKVPKAVREKYKLRGPKDMTFAQAFKSAQRESEERPNDPISKKGLENSAAILAASQEALKQEEEQKQYMRALGGNLFRNGGNTNNPKKEKNNAVYSVEEKIGDLENVPLHYIIESFIEHPITTTKILRNRNKKREEKQNAGGGFSGFGGGTFNGGGAGGTWGERDMVSALQRLEEEKMKDKIIYSPGAPVETTTRKSFGQIFDEHRRAGDKGFWLDGVYYTTDVDPNAKIGSARYYNVQGTPIPTVIREVEDGSGKVLPDSTTASIYTGQALGKFDRKDDPNEIANRLNAMPFYNGEVGFNGDTRAYGGPVHKFLTGSLMSSLDDYPYYDGYTENPSNPGYNNGWINTLLDSKIPFNITYNYAAPIDSRRTGGVAAAAGATTTGTTSPQKKTRKQIREEERQAEKAKLAMEGDTADIERYQQIPSEEEVDAAVAAGEDIYTKRADEAREAAAKAAEATEAASDEVSGNNKEGDEDDSKKSNLSALRYFSTLANAGAVLTDALGITNRPTVFDKIKGPALVRAPRLGNYLPVMNLDTRYESNVLAQQANATRNALMQSIAPSRAANILAADALAQSKMGELMRNAELANYDLAVKRAEYNRDTDKTNAQYNFAAAVENAKNKMANASELLKQAKMNDEAETLAWAAKAQNIKTLADNISNIGREKDALSYRDMFIKMGPTLADYMRPTGWSDEEWAKQKEMWAKAYADIIGTNKVACGGKISRKKRRGLTY